MDICLNFFINNNNSKQNKMCLIKQLRIDLFYADICNHLV